MMEDWAEKYRPHTLREVQGNPTAIRQLENWGRSWQAGPPKKRAALLVGAPGVGKTSAAHALATDMGWGVVEMNASDARNAEAIRLVATRGSRAETFTSAGEYISSRDGGRKLIILDEADNLSGRQDSGGVAAITDAIRNTQQPIVLIVNDQYELTRRSSSLKSLTETIKFQRASLPAVKAALKRVAKGEGLILPDAVADFLAERSGGDLRAGINDLQSIGQGRREVSEGDVVALGYRDVKGEIFSALAKVFRSGRFDEAVRSTEGLDEDPDRVLLWVDENLPFEYVEPGDLARGYDALAKADIYLGRVRRRQRYGFWSYAGEMMTGGVAVARRGRPGGAQFRFPLWLSKMSRSRGVRATVGSLAGKLGVMMHTTPNRVRRDILPTFSLLYREQPDLRVKATAILGLEAKEVAYLMGEDEDSKLVKEILEAASSHGPTVEVRPFSRFEGSEDE